MSHPTFSDRKYRLRKRDIMLIGGLVLLSLFPWFRGGQKRQGEYVIVKTPAGLFRYRLRGERVVPIAAGHGTIELLFTKGSVRVLHTGCPRKLCKKQGAIRASGERIICVPWRIEIMVEGRLRKGDVICR